MNKEEMDKRIRNIAALVITYEGISKSWEGSAGDMARDRFVSKEWDGEDSDNWYASELAHLIAFQ